MMVYERIPPEGRCVTPDGHDCEELLSMRSPIPEHIFCPHCGKDWTVVVFEDDDDE